MSKPPETLLTEVVVKQVAALAVSGATPGEIAAKLGMTKWQVKKAMQLPAYKAYMKEVGDAALSTAKEFIRAEMGKLSKEIMRVIRTQLEEKDSLDAVKIALKVVGFDQEEQVKGDTTLNVIMPGANKPETKDVPNLVIDMGTQEGETE